MLRQPWLILLALACASPVFACELRIESGWIPTPIPVARTWAAYGTLVNSGKSAASIVSAASTAAGRVELHRSSLDGAVARMRAVARLEVPAGGKVELAQGGTHLMLVDPKLRVRNGDKLTISLKDSTGCVIAGEFVVGARSGGASPADDNVAPIDHSMHGGALPGHEHH